MTPTWAMPPVHHGRTWLIGVVAGSVMTIGLGLLALRKRRCA
ncbi:MAG TPA: hypothetical protein VGU25_13345 [Acidobacteriaceae bacterium]|nr:hypothetical protein [Acidobacteriaceae bacterium]